MSITKMKYINIIGRIEDFDKVTEQCLAKHDIHLENAMNELQNVAGLRTFNDINTYAPMIKQMETLLSTLEITLPTVTRSKMPKHVADKIFADTVDVIKGCILERDEALMRADKATELRAQIIPLQGMDFDLSQMWHFEFIKFRFGKLPRNNYDKLDRYISNTNETIFIPCLIGADYVWGMYFTPEPFEEHIDALFSSLHFERFKISGVIEGTPKEAYERLTAEIERDTATAQSAFFRAKEYVEQNIMQISEAMFNLQYQNNCFNVRKFAACTNQRYYIVGWVPEKSIDALLEDLSKDPHITYVVSDKDTVFASTPPTQLKNPALFKPFEMFVENYGLPAYDEFDPTIFLGITYSVLFGIMFGDIGQGLVLMLGGLLIHHFTKMRLAAIVSIAGCFSVIFGGVYGSIFGNEEIIKTALFRPSHDVMTALMYAVCIGIALIIVSMLLNIYNNMRRHDWANMLCSPSGVSGLLFYITLFFGVVLPLFGVTLIPTEAVSVIAIVTLFLIAAHSPLHRWAKKETPIFPDGIKGYLTMIVFELFEILLSYVTNTVSFVRVGAFALSHAGMMAVVFLLMENAGSVQSTFIWVGGNILVIGLEGLIVGIQVLRLDFYEMFSRFYSGEGRKFVNFAQRNLS